MNKLESKIAEKVELISRIVAVISILILTTICSCINNTSIKKINQTCEARIEALETNLQQDSGKVLSQHPNKDESDSISKIESDAVIWSFVFAIICAVIYQFLYIAFALLYKKYWMCRKHKQMNISGENWYVIQTTVDDDMYLRVGNVMISQVYDQYLIQAITFNVRYIKEADTFQKSQDAQLTTSEERGTVLTEHKIRGAYYAGREDSSDSRDGLYDATIEEHNKQKFPIKISGKFVDADFTGKKPRSGQKLLYKDKEAYETDVKRICKERCEKLCINIFTSKIQKKVEETNEK